MTPPKGIPDLEGVVASARPDAIISIPAIWLGELLAYLRAVETEAQMQRADEPDAGTA